MDSKLLVSNNKVIFQKPETKFLNKRLDKYIGEIFPNVSYSVIQKAIRNGNIKLESKKVKYDYKLQSGDVVRIPLLYLNNVSQEGKKSVKKPFNRSLYKSQIQKIVDSVIYKDENFIILNKPSSIAVQGGSKVNFAVSDCLSDLKFDYDCIPHLVHRIDKDTSGILILARTKEVAANMHEIFLSKQIYKSYYAMVYDNLLEDIFTIDEPLEKSLDNYEVMELYEHGKPAVTHFEVVSCSKTSKVKLVKAVLETGRKHQIRAHIGLACNSPVIGDFKYGFRSSMLDVKLNKLYLHSYKVEFDYQGNKISVCADIPQDFAKIMSQLGLSI